MWYSSQIPLISRDQSTNGHEACEQASKPRELLVHKARHSDLKTRNFDSNVNKLFENENPVPPSQNSRNLKKISRILLLFAVIAMTIIGISGQHLFPEKLAKLSEALKLINVEAFELYKNTTVALNEDKSKKSLENEPSQATEDKPTPNAKYSRSLVLLDLEDWRKNWASRDLKNFMTYYHPDFPELKNFESNKKRIFKKTKYIKISLKNIVSRIDGDNIITSFTQIYKSKNYNDNSVKELIWAKTKLGWKIIQEKNINSSVAKQEKK